MYKEIKQKIERHQKFLEHKETDRPIIGFYIGGWESLDRYFKKPENLFEKGVIIANELTTDKFYNMYKSYSKNIKYNDDFVHSLEPFQSIPWVEAACGCPIIFTGKNFWSQKIGFDKSKAKIENIKIRNNPWITKYAEFIKFLAHEFPHYPIGQSILRGPLDVMCAMVGDSETIYNLYDEPDFIKKGLSIIADVFNEFIRIQYNYTPKYKDGHVIGQYYIWTPGTVCRIQEDAMALINPDHYIEYVFENDVKITSRTKYSFYHIHSSGMFLINEIVRNKNLNIIQVSKDEGNIKLSDFIVGLKAIQSAGMSVLVKGRFDENDIDILRKHLDKRALAIGFVIDSIKETDELKSYLDNLRW